MKAVFLLCLLCGCILFSLHATVAFELAGCEMFGGEPAVCVWFH